MTDAQRQYLLRQQMKAIQTELGEGEGESQELRARVAEAHLPERIELVALREVDRLERMTPASPEYQMIRTYLDWLLDVPWDKRGEDRLDPVEARRVLDEDHYDLDKVKERIVEYLAVQKLRQRRSAEASVERVPVRRTGVGHRNGARSRRPRRRTAHDEGADPLLRRAAGRRQDIAGPVDCALDEPQVRADLARRRQGRGGDSRPSPHLHRVDARPYRAGAEDRRGVESGADARRNRQDLGRRRRATRPPRCSKCWTRRRTTRFAITTSRSRWTCRGCCSSRQRTSSARSTRRCSTGWRSSR